MTRLDGAPPGTVIETGRLWLREWVPDDAARFRSICTDPQVMRYIRDGSIWTDDEVAAFIERERARARTEGYCLWALILRDGGELVGQCGLKQLAQTDMIETGWWIARARWGQGLATEAARAVRDAAFLRFGLERIVAIAHPDNAASIRVMEKIGMIFVKRTTGSELGTRWKGPYVLYEARRGAPPGLARPAS
jgi:RimJ/RimL family protein N-acetyltransferase